MTSIAASWLSVLVLGFSTSALACLKTSVGVPDLLICECGAATDTDDFDDNAKDPAKWGADENIGNGSLAEQVTRLEYLCTSGTARDRSFRPWIRSALP